MHADELNVTISWTQECIWWRIKKIKKSLITISVLFWNILATVTEQILFTTTLQIIATFSKRLNSNKSKNYYPTFHNFI